MKLSLEVLTAGKWQGKIVPIPKVPFVIGRDPRCHLRPASPLISNRHCALLVKGDKLFVHDFGSTNGTLVNGRQVRGEIELQHQDHLQVGPIAFTVRLETAAAAVNTPTPLPPTRAAAGGEDDDAAAALLLMGGEDAAPGSPGVDDTGIPTGNTVLLSASEMAAQNAALGEAAPTKEAAAAAAKKIATGDTSTAAKAILEKYLRRPRGEK